MGCWRLRRYPQLAAELLALAPDVIVANNGNLVRTLQEASSTVPIVFVGTIDPVAAGRISSLARPGGNATGFLAFEYGIAGKWLELLKQIAPHVTRVAVLRDPSNVGGAGMYGAIQGAAPSFGVEFTAGRSTRAALKLLSAALLILRAAQTAA